MNFIMNHGKPLDLCGITLDSRYAIKEFIGAGGMGSVWLAVDTTLEQQVAIKILSPDNYIDPNLRKRFIREVKSALKIKHQNVIAMYNYGHEVIDADGRQVEISWCVMEYCKGESLKEIQLRMEENTGKAIFQPQEALRITSEILSALSEIHAQHILHRDLKPENIMLDASTSPARAKILDFGIVRILDEISEQLTAVGTTLGTVDYISPDLINADDNIDHRSDLYSLGVMLYELLTGELPYAVTTGIEVLTQDAPPLSAELIPDAELRIMLDNLLKNAMQKDPEKRFQTAQAFMDDIDKIRLYLASAPAPAIAHPIPKKLDSPLPAATAEAVPRPAHIATAKNSPKPKTKSSLTPVLLILLAVCLLGAGLIGYNYISSPTPEAASAQTPEPEPKKTTLRVEKTALGKPGIKHDTLGIEFTQTGGGEFSPKNITELQGKNVILDTFAISTHEVSWLLYLEYFPQAKAKMPITASRTDAVSGINWWEAVEFCKLLSTKTGKNYRLPTEVEWEYALSCAGKDTTKQQPQYDSVNNWGIARDSLLVGEWCLDSYTPKHTLSTLNNPVNLEESKYRVVRKGVASNKDRAYQAADVHSDKIGFRLVKTD